MRYFLDTEFHENFYKPFLGKRRHFIDLISIGIVAEDGREYYAISRDFDLKAAWNNHWLRENVLRSIYNELLKKERYAFQYHEGLVTPFSYKTLKTLISWNGKSNKKIAEEIIEFINNEPIETIKYSCSVHLSEQSAINIRKGHVSPEFYGYYADYDWVLFCSIFGTMMDLPKGFPMYCKDLKQSLDETANSLTSIQLSKLAYPSVSHDVFDTLNTGVIKDRVNCLKQAVNYPKQENEHNALADANWNKQLYNFLQTI